MGWLGTFGIWCSPRRSFSWVTLLLGQINERSSALEGIWSVSLITNDQLMGESSWPMPG